ncbi:MAG: cell division protein FtsQ/DivIB [Nitrospiraceae bacterium]
MTWFGRAKGPRPNVRRQAARPAASRRPVNRLRQTVRAVWRGTAVLLGAWTAIQLYGLTGPVVAGWFEIREVRVTGLHTVTRDAVLGRLQIDPRATLLSVSPMQLEERVAAHPWVKTASVSRTPFHALSVHVTERRPAALLKAPSSTLLVDEDGAVLATLSALAEEDHPDLPVVVGVDPKRLLLGEARPRQAVQQGIRLARLLARSGEGRPEVDVSDPEHAIAYIQGMRVQFGAAPLEEQWNRYRAVEPVRRAGAGKGSPDIDLRFSDKVIVREREQLS